MRKWLIALAAVGGMTGCVSIATHEKMMQQCRKTAEEAEHLRSQAEALESKARDLEEKLSESDSDREQLEAQISEIRSTYDELVENLKKDISEGDVGVEKNEDKLKITMGNKVLFRSGSDRLQPKGKEILLAVSKSLRKVTGNRIQVEGHTDNVPISGALKRRFPTNWDLSAARAAAVVRFLQEQGKVPPAQMTLAAFGEHQPVGENKTPTGREQNRRVEIRLVPSEP